MPAVDNSELNVEGRGQGVVVVVPLDSLETSAVVVVVGAVVVVVVLRRAVVVVVGAGAVVVVVWRLGAVVGGATAVVVGAVDEVVDEVVDDVDEVVVESGSVVVVAFTRSRSSGDAVNRGVGLTPSWATFITSEKICAGNDPPVTSRPWTPFIGLRSVRFS